MKRTRFTRFARLGMFAFSFIVVAVGMILLMQLTSKKSSKQGNTDGISGGSNVSYGTDDSPEEIKARLDDLGTAIWMPENPPLKLAPYMVAHYGPVAGEGKFLQFDTPPDIEIYESIVPKGHIPVCGERYPGDIILDGSSCHEAGALPQGVTVYVDEPMRIVHAVFDTTMVVVRPVKPRMTVEELVAYLKTFREVDNMTVATLLTDNYKELKSTVARQAELADFMPLLPSEEVLKNYDRAEMVLTGFDDPTKPTLDVTYVEKSDANSSMSLWAGPVTNTFQPPGDCGPSADYDYLSKHPCHVVEASGTNSIYTSNDGDFTYVRSGDSLTVIEARGKTLQNITSIARSFTRMPKEIFKQAETLQY